MSLMAPQKTNDRAKVRNNRNNPEEKDLSLEEKGCI